MLVNAKIRGLRWAIGLLLNRFRDYLIARHELSAGHTHMA